MGKSKKSQSQLIQKKRQKRADRTKERKVAQRAVSIINKIVFCLAPSNEQLKTKGIGTVLVVTSSSSIALRVTVFLVDSFCLGVKKVDSFNIASADLAQMVEAIQQNEESQEVSVSYAKKLVEDAIAWSSSLGFSPSPDVLKALQVFKNTSSATCGELFEFGSKGKPFYIAGPKDSIEFSKLVCKTLEKSCGEGGYNYVVEAI
jgi:hypothetical protein